MYMAATTTKKRWTRADLRAIPDDGNRYEIIDGELFVTPSPSPVHQRLVMRLLLLLHVYVDEHRIGEVLPSPADIELADDTVVQPDVFVASRLDGKVPQRWEDFGPLLLAVEILSPDTARTDRRIKRHRYQRDSIPEYWIVDGDARVVERWRPEDERPEIVIERLEWMPDARVAPLVIDLPALFVATLGT